MQRYKVFRFPPNVFKKKMRKITSFSLFLTNNRFLEAKRGENGRFRAPEGIYKGDVGGLLNYITRARRGILGRGKAMVLARDSGTGQRSVHHRIFKKAVLFII